MMATEQDREAVVVLDENRQVVWMDADAEDLTGWASDDAAGIEFCHELFRCQDESGKPLSDVECPGLQGLEQPGTATSADYIITRKDGQKVRVHSTYQFLHEPAGGRHIGLLRMKCVEKPSAEIPLSTPAVNTRGLVAIAIAMVALLVLIVFAVERTQYQWLTLDEVRHLSPGEPNGIFFTYPDSLKMGGTIAMGQVVVTVEPGKPVTAITGDCPYDGGSIEWNPKKGVFLCPTDGSIFERDGTFYKGKAWTSLRPLAANIEDERVRVRVPKSRPIPSKDQPQETYPEYWGP